MSAEAQVSGRSALFIILGLLVAIAIFEVGRHASPSAAATPRKQPGIDVKKVPATRTVAPTLPPLKEGERLNRSINTKFGSFAKEAIGSDSEKRSMKWWRDIFTDKIPGGYQKDSCITSPRQQVRERFTDTATLWDARGKDGASCSKAERRLRQPILTEAERKKMQLEVYAQFHPNATLPSWVARSELRNIRQTAHAPNRKKFLGIRLLCAIGRSLYGKTTGPAIRRMLQPFGGTAIHVTFLHYTDQTEEAEPLLKKMDIPPKFMKRVTWSPEKVKLFDFRRFYRDVEDDYLHIKLDDDLLYIAPDLELLLAHAFFFPEDHGPPPPTSPGSPPFRCEVVSANVVNHHCLTAVHQQLGAIDTFKPRPMMVREHVKSSDYGPHAVWSALHRSFLGSLTANSKKGEEMRFGEAVTDERDPRSTLERFDFGLFDFNCDGIQDRKRRWSINAFLFPWSRDEALKIPMQDELYIAAGVPYKKNGRGSACSLGSALVVHALFQHQKVWAEQHSSPAALNDALNRLSEAYEAVTADAYGIKPCCSDNKCPIFAVPSTGPTCGSFLGSAVREDSGAVEFDLDAALNCTFPYASDTPQASLRSFLRGSSVLHLRQSLGGQKKPASTKK